jgi:hypothetical protein
LLRKERMDGLAMVFAASMGKLLDGTFWHGDDGLLRIGERWFSQGFLVHGVYGIPPGFGMRDGLLRYMVCFVPVMCACVCDAFSDLLWGLSRAGDAGL